jgi:hypothetical protein
VSDPYGITTDEDGLYHSGAGRTTVRRSKALKIVAAVSGCGAAVAVGTFIIRPVEEFSCDPTVLVADTSSSGLSAEARVVVADVLAAAAERSALCDAAFHAIAVRGATPQLVMSDADLEDVTTGTNVNTRKKNLDEVLLGSAVDDSLERMYAAGAADAAVSSIPALYSAASEFGGDQVDLIIATDGVQDADGVSLNRSLSEGEGSEVAQSIDVEVIEVGSATLFGLSLVDVQTSPPGERWVREVIDANSVLCKRATGLDCRTFAVASAEDIVR